jgi:hypothetical protein
MVKSEGRQRASNGGRSTADRREGRAGRDGRDFSHASGGGKRQCMTGTAQCEHVVKVPFPLDAGDYFLERSPLVDGRRAAPGLDVLLQYNDSKLLCFA